MAHIKAHEVDRYIKQPSPDHRVMLVYGPDSGLVSERARKLAEQSGADLSDPFSTIVIAADEAAADSNRIADEAHTVSMFGGKRLVWIKGSTQKNLANAVQPTLDLPPQDALILIEAGDLKKSSPLRSRIEKAAAAIALPCYQDQQRTLDLLIDEEINRHNLKIEPEARQYLKELLGGDRMASRNEIQKLCLYAAEKSVVTLQDVSEIVGDASSLVLDTVIDATSIGDIQQMESMFKRLIARGTAVFQIINALQRHFQTLHVARVQMETRGQPASSIVATLRPPVNFQRKDKVIRALASWSPTQLERILQRLEAVSLETRSNAALAVPLASTALLAIAIEARRNQR